MPKADSVAAALLTFGTVSFFFLKQVVYGLDFLVILATLPYRDRWRNVVEVLLLLFIALMPRVE